MIEISGLRKNFGDNEVLKNINLTINDGDIYGLVGVSGAGKSTLLRCINGLVPYDSGSLKVDGIEVNGLGKKELRYLQKDIGMIFQNFELMSRKTVYQNIAFPMKCWNYPKKEIDDRVHELAEIVGISDKLNENPRNLSGGQKQRVAIARALTMNPKILLSDEATSALDPLITQSILALLRDINKNYNITIVVVTHQMEVVRGVCNNIALLQNGELTETGSVEKIFLEQSPSFRSFIGETLELPTRGVNLQIMFNNDTESRSFLCDTVRGMDTNFSMVSAKTEKFGEKNLQTMVLNFEHADLNKVQNYLSEKNIQWRQVEQ